MENVELQWIHTGQYSPYGDSYYVCAIHTTKELENSDICQLVGNVGPHSKPPKAAWEAKDLTAEEYFRGWFKIEKTTYGYLYTACEPYTG